MERCHLVVCFALTNRKRSIFIHDISIENSPKSKFFEFFECMSNERPIFVGVVYPRFDQLITIKLEEKRENGEEERGREA